MGRNNPSYTEDRSPEFMADVSDRNGNPMGPVRAAKVQPLRIELTVDQIRLLGGERLRLKGRSDFTTKEAEAFILLYRDQITARVNNLIRDFMKDKL